MTYNNPHESRTSYNAYEFKGIDKLIEDFLNDVRRVRHEALKFYYGSILKKKFIYEVKRPRKDKKLPIVLSQS